MLDRPHIGYDPFPGGYQRMPRVPDEAVELLLQTAATPLIGADTAVTSLGSCFADNIRIYLKQQGFNYLQVEPDCDGFTANWGRVYNSASLRQIFAYSESQTFPLSDRWWPHSSGGVSDPYRAVAEYPTEQAAAEDFARHMACSRASLQQAGVVIVTVGLIEAWRSVRDGRYYHGRPPAPHREAHEFHVMTYDEVWRDLSEIRATALRLNPAVQLILTVSPVPLRATFRTDMSALSASAFSKAVLLAATQSFCLQHADTHYFPSFEIVRDVLGARINTRGTYDSDVLDTVMRIFRRCFVHG